MKKQIRMNNHSKSERRVLLFVRAPELGRVKTRLEKKIDAATVLALYRCFVEDIMETLTTGGYDIIVFFWPPHRGSAVQVWLGDTVPVRPQEGKTLGEKMRNAFSNVFTTDASQAVLIGSDFPDLDIRIIDEAFEFLQKKEVVIGPAVDGGYYLIGFQKTTFDGNVFTGIDWGTARVFQETMRHIHDAGLREHVLPMWQDIDTYEDLVAFYHRSEASELTHLKTIKFLKQRNLKGFQ